MFTILNDKTICLTRGDIATLDVSANQQNNEPYTFVAGDVVRFKVFEKKNCNYVILSKDVIVDTATTTVSIPLTSAETKIGTLVNKPIDYFYEIELNPDTNPQTIIAYDPINAKIFRLFPEGGDLT